MKSRRATRFWFTVALMLTFITAFCNAVLLLIWTDHPGKIMGEFARSYFLFFSIMTILLMLPTIFLWKRLSR